MPTTLFVAHALAGLPVFLAAVFLWWQAAQDRKLDDVAVDPRFQSGGGE